MLSVDQLHWLLTFLKSSVSYVVSTSLGGVYRPREIAPPKASQFLGAVGRLRETYLLCADKPTHDQPHPDSPSYSTCSPSQYFLCPKSSKGQVPDSEGKPQAPKSTRMIQTRNPRLCPLPCLAFPMKTPKVILLYILICLIYTDFSIYQIPLIGCYL